VRVEGSTEKKDEGSAFIINAAILVSIQDIHCSNDFRSYVNVDTRVIFCAHLDVNLSVG